MGNRAVISFSEKKTDTGVYLHWNGGIESVLAFVEAAKQMGARDPASDPLYAMAGLVRAVTLFMHYRAGELLSVGVGTVGELDTDNYDNGHYIVGKGWEITKRLHSRDMTKTVAELSAEQRDQYNGMLAVILERHVLLCEHDKASA